MNDILFVIVLYKKLPEESIAYKSLVHLLGKGFESDLYVHDNTYLNLMLAKAYNCGIEEAVKRSKKWIVLLDDDTRLSEDYLKQLKEYTSNENVSVCVPNLYSEQGRKLSPKFYYPSLGPFLYLSERDIGAMSFFNSGLAIRVSVIKDLGGFNTEFPLDCLDSWLSHVLFLKKIKVEILPVNLFHNLSVLDYNNHVSLNRYRSIMDGQRNLAHFIGKRAYFFYKLRVLLRCIKWTLNGHRYLNVTYKELLKRQ